ncbi:AAA family ATPase, partial [Gilliamella apicola]
MYLESLKIINYRRFGEKDNIVYFVNPKKISHSREKNSTKQSLISPSTTLIIGKNNAGKTTITNALIFITDKQKKWPKSSDFNVYYLKNLIKTYKIAYENKEKSDVIQLPKLEFIVKVNYSAEDLTTNISGISINSNDSSEESIEKKVTYEPKEAVSFNEGIKAIFEETEKSDGDASSKDHLLLEKLCDLLDNCEYKITYINVKDGNESNPLHDLISIKTISANRHLNENVLSKVFQRIVSSQFEDINSEDLFKDDIETINKTITDKVQTKNESVSRILKKIEQNNHVDMKLKGNVSKKTILKSFIKYNFKEGDDFIPEDQFGLGYVNLLNIIGEIIYYIDTYEENCHQSRINLLIIEEPEIFMHPQMQEFFISRIDNAIHEALEVAKLSSKSKNSLHCQIILTTHSSHIVNSKVQSCKSFNNINYLTIKDKYTVAIPLDDNNILEENSKTETEKKKKKKKKKKKNDLLFLIKHIKYKVSELFFSDAVIFVEGVTEEALLPYYLEQNNILN